MPSLASEGLRIRLARASDAPAVAAVTAAAFEPAWAAAARASGSGPVAAAAAVKLQRVTEARVQAQVIEWAEARAEARATARASAAAPSPSVFATPRELRATARATAKADETRRTALLLAEDTTTGRIVAALALLRRAAGAALPPPFPSAAPRVAYIASVATDPSHRRRGAARALLTRAAARASAWGDDTVWLHAPRGGQRPRGRRQRAVCRSRVRSSRPWGPQRRALGCGGGAESGAAGGKAHVWRRRQQGGRVCATPATTCPGARVSIY